MSGQANVIAWLTKRGLSADAETVDRILAQAKAGNCVLREEDVLELLGSGESGNA